MPQTNETDTLLYLLIGVAILVFIIPAFIGLLAFFNSSSRELKYINCEIHRNTGAERQYWIRKKRRLWLSLIPFVKYR